MADTGLASEAARRRRRGESELVFIDSTHQNIHDGIFFSSGVNDTALANGANLDALLRVATSAHIVITVAVGGDATFRGFRDAVASADGTPVLVVNRNFFSPNVAGSLVFEAPTLTSPGDQRAEQLVIGGSGGQAAGGESTFFLEWLLSPGDYLLRLTNDSGQVRRAQLLLDWYEREAPVP
jgi:hypothetical protein